MTITARVHNRTITLPADCPVEEGAEVEVVVPDPVPAAAEGEPRPESFSDTIRDLIGSAKGLPKDFAAEHDHYIHGTRRRSER